MRSIAFAACFVSLCACTSVLRVKQGNLPKPSAQPIDLPGIPFHTKKEQFRQTTTWSKTWLRATLTVDEKTFDSFIKTSTPISSNKQVYVRDVATITMLDTFRTAILTIDGAINAKNARDLIGQFTSLVTLPNDSTIAGVLLKNVMEPEWIIDSSTTYYINAPLPWFGTGTFTQELNADGTLSKASASADTKLASSISSLIPVNQLLTKTLIGAAGATGGGNKLGAQRLTENVVYTFTLETVDINRQYVLTKVFSDGSIRSPIAMTEIEAGTAMVEIKDMSSQSTKDDAKVGSKVGIEGNVTFPKDWNTPAKPTSK